MTTGFRERKEWQFFATLPKADRRLASAWWGAILLRGILPASFAVAMGVLVRAVQQGEAIGGPLVLMGGIFMLLQVLPAIHQVVSTNLGDRTAAWLYDRLTEACVRPDGIGHLEDPAFTTDLTVARDFDLGMTGPPMHISVDFIAGGLVEIVAGLACALVLVGYAWWAPILLGGAWLATHWLMRESAVWRDRNTDDVRAARRDADYGYRLAVDPAPAKELRLFGLASWTIDRFVATRTRLQALQHEATRLRERPVLWSLLLVTGANLVLFWSLASSASAGVLTLAEAVVYAQSAVGASMIAFGGLNWALDDAAAPVAAVLRLHSSLPTAGRLRDQGGQISNFQVEGVSNLGRIGSDAADVQRAGSTAGNFCEPAVDRRVLQPSGSKSTNLRKPEYGEENRQNPVSNDEKSRSDPAPEIHFRGVTFGYPGGGAVLDGLDLVIPAGTSLAIVGQNGAGKTTLAKLLCRLYDPQAGAIEIDGIDLRHLPPAAWRRRIAAVFQDFVRFELPLRENVAPAGAPDAIIRAALAAAGAAGLADLDTILAKGYDGGTDLSGGQWQRVALARALCAVALGAGVVILDEPTAQLDVRGEAEIFDRILTATRDCTTILISHRFSTVRHADRICVLESGRVVELGTHAELMAQHGRYRTMFDLQARRFVSANEEGLTYDVLG